MDESQSLNVEITADASSTVAAADASIQSFDRLEAALAKITAAAEPLAQSFAGLEGTLFQSEAASTAAAGGIDKVGASAARTSGLADALTEHSLLMSRGFEAMGLQAGTAATRVGALGDTLERFAVVNPAILAMVASMTLLFGAFEAFKSFVDEGAHEALAAQNAMTELRIAVEQNGGSWADAAPKIEEWARSLTLASGIVESQSLPALLNLVNAGQTLDGSMAEVTIAADVAAAGMGRMGRGADNSENSARQFKQAIMALNEAMAGHVTRLETIDARLTPLIDKHASMHDILLKLLEDTENAISKNDSLQMTYQRLHGEVDIASESFAKGFMPIAKETVDVLAVLADGAGHVASAFAEMAEGVMQNLKAVVSGSIAMGAAARDAFANQGDIGHQLAIIRQSADAVQHSFGTMGQGLGKAAYDAFHPATLYAKDLHDALNRLATTAQSGIGDLADYAKAPKAKGAGATGYNAPASSYEQDQVQRTQQQTAASAELARVTDALITSKTRASQQENIYENAVKLSTTTEAQAAAQRALDLLKISDSSDQVRILTSAIARETTEQQKLSGEHKAAEAEYERLNKQLSDTQHGHEGVKKTALETKEAMEKLAAAVADAKARMEDTGRALQTVNGALRTHRDELVQAQNAERDAADKEAEDLAGLSRKWSSFYEKQVSDDADSVARRTLSGKKLLDYDDQLWQSDYQKFLYWLGQKDTAQADFYESRSEEELRKLTEEENQLYQQDYNNQKQWLDKAANSITQFLDQVLTGNKSLEANLKTIYADILKAFEEMITKMIAASQLLRGVEQSFLGLFGGGASPFQGGAIPGGSGGIDTSMVNQFGFGPTGAPLGSSSQNAGSPLGPSAVSSAVAGAGSYGILGALLGTEGAAQVVSAISGGSGVSAPGRSTSAGAPMNLTLNVPSSSSVAGAMAGPSAAASSGASHGGASTLGGSSGAPSGGRNLSSIFTGLSSTGSGIGTAGNIMAAALSGGGSMTPLSGGAAGSLYDAGDMADSAYNPATGAAPGGATMLSGLKIGGVGLGSLLTGAIGGSMIANMLDHGNQDASIGGMIGGAGGTLLGSLIGKLLFTGGAAAGPVGMIIGSVLGALLGTAIGGLFGDHFPKANEPDIYQTQQWGQELADLQGSTSGDPMNANGQKFTMDSWTNSQTQGKGWNILFEQFVAKFRNNTKALPQELQAGFPMIENLWGGAQNQADFDGNGKNGMLQLGSGPMASWTTFWGYVGAYGPAIAQLMAMYTPTDLYSASLKGSVSDMGGYTPSGDPFLLHAFPDAGSPAAGPSPSASFDKPRGNYTINLIQQFQGSLIADTAFDDRIKKSISTIPIFSQLDLNST